MPIIEKDITDILEFEKKYSIEWNLLNQITEPMDKRNPLNTTLIYYDNHPRSKFIGGIIINIVDNNFTIGTFTEDLQIGSLWGYPDRKSYPSRTRNTPGSESQSGSCRRTAISPRCSPYRSATAS